MNIKTIKGLELQLLFFITVMILLGIDINECTPNLIYSLIAFGGLYTYCSFYFIPQWYKLAYLIDTKEIIGRKIRLFFFSYFGRCNLLYSGKFCLSKITKS